MHFLLYGGQEDELVVNGYTDASFQTDKDDFRSQSGYVFFLNEMKMPEYMFGFLM